MRLEQPFFIVGSGRSGTTLLYRLLEGHPHVALTNEGRIADFLLFCVEYARTPAFQPMSFAHVDRLTLHGMVGTPYLKRFTRIFSEHAKRALESFFVEQFEHKDATHWGDKLPDPSAAVGFQAAYPNTKYIVVIRDPRDVVCSIRRFAERPEVAALNPFLANVPLPEWCTYWRNMYEAFSQYLHQHLLLRYEDLVRDPIGHGRDALRWLGLQCGDDQLQRMGSLGALAGHATARSPGASIGRWREELSAADVATIESTCGDLMRVHGYALEPEASSDPGLSAAE